MRVTLLLVAMLSPALSLAGQAAPPGYPVKKCEALAVPIGSISGIGALQYQLRADGRPDTASLGVLESPSLSPAALRSAAVRQLSACRMDLGRDKSKAPLWVRQAILFQDSLVRLAPARPVTQGTPLSATPVNLAEVLLPVAGDDPRLEERPRPVNCERDMVIRKERVGRLEDVAREVGEARRATTGRIRARFLVAVDGEVAPTSVQILESTNPAANDYLAYHISACLYAPGRLGGQPVPVLFETVREEAPMANAPF